MNTMTKLQQFIAEIAAEINTCETSPEIALRNLIRKKHYWPQFQVKSFFDVQCNGRVVLLHNTYKRQDVKHFQTLYDEFRSVILDMGDKTNIKILALTNGIPKQVSIPEYSAMMDPNDSCYLTYEGTLISCYYAYGKWHFSTASCPKVDSSRYSHPTKTHGQMFDEALSKEFGFICRDDFTNNLDKTLSYNFILIHYENCKVIDHTDVFDEKFCKIMHVGTHLNGVNVFDTTPVLQGIKRPAIVNATTMLGFLATANPLNTHGFLIKRNSTGEMLKLQMDKVVSLEAETSGHPNPWYNMLIIYKQNNPSYKVNDYIAKYNIDITQSPEQPTYVIHTTICTMRDMLFSLYNATTVFDTTLKRYTMNKETDQALPPIIRFHLSQLRFIQITSHNYAVLTDRAVYKYICGLTIKNFRILLRFLVNTAVMQNIPPRAANSMWYLNNILFTNKHTHIVDADIDVNTDEPNVNVDVEMV